MAFLPPVLPWLQTGFTMGTVSYNGFAFPNPVESKIQIEPVYESSGRVPKWWKHTLTLECIISPDLLPQTSPFGVNSTDINMEVAKRYLTVPGGLLQFNLRGFGHNATSTAVAGGTYTVDKNRDLNFGPKPLLLNWEPVGANRAVRIQWSVEFATTLCCYAELDGDGVCDNPGDTLWSSLNPTITEFNYSSSFNVDEEGWVVRSIVGSLETQGLLYNVAAPGALYRTGTTIGAGQAGAGNTTLVAGPDATPNSSQTLPLTFAQNWITNLFQPLTGFLRNFQWDLSRDGRRLDFRITDTEVQSDNPLIKGIIKCQVTHGMTSDLPFYRWESFIRGRFTIQPKVARSTAWFAFLAIMKSRLGFIKTVTENNMVEVINTDGEDLKKVSTDPCYIPRKISLEEDIYGRTFNFDFRYTVFCSLENIMQVSGLFTPVAPNDWTTWTTSLPSDLRNGRGSAGLSSSGTNNIVVRCTAGTPASSTLTQPSKNPYDKPGTKIFSYECPPPEKSWLYYNLWFEWEEIPNAVVHQKTYQVDPKTYNPGMAGGTTTGDLLRLAIAASLPGARLEQAYDYSNPDYKNVVQYMSTYQRRVYLCGNAIRACRDATIPELLSIGGQKPFSVKRSLYIKNKRVGDAGPVPLYYSAWRIAYDFVLPPVVGNGAGMRVETNGIPEEYMKGTQFDEIFTNIPDSP